MIKRLEIKNLRGIRYLNLDIGKKSIMVYGENGRGKSSIIDAIEWTLTGKISHLAEGGQNVSFEKHAHHLSATSGQKEVTIEFDDSSILSTTCAPKSGTKAESYRLKSGQGLNILRRAQLLQAICTKPKDRYELLKPFLPLSKVSEIESTSQQVLEKLENEIKMLNAKIHELSIQIAIRLDMNTKDTITGKKILEAIQIICNSLSINPPSSLDKLAETKEILEKETSLVTGKPIFLRDQNILAILKQIREIPSLVEQHRLLYESFKEYISISKNKDKLFNEQLLQLGYKWIQDGNLEKCPLCLSNIDTYLVCQEISNRLENEASYISCRKLYIDNVNLIKGSVNKWATYINQLSKLIVDPNDNEIIDLIKCVKDISFKLTESTLLKNPEIATSFDVFEWNEMIDAQIDVLIEKYENILASYGDSDKVIKILKLQDAIESIEANLPLINNTLERFVQMKKARDYALQWKETLEKQRKQEVQNIYNSIKELINDYYSKIHPKSRNTELVGDINLTVRETGGGSALLQAAFHNKTNEDPRSYYSESHLDTLGLCIFLALYKKETENNQYMRILVLDDVLTSVDAPHRKRVADLLLTEFKDHQIIVTTHDIVWHNDFLDLQKKYGISFKNIKIDDWDIINGPKIADVRTGLDELTMMISMGMDKSIIAGSAGRLLELILNKLRYSLRFSIEAKPDDKYTIGDIWPYFYSRLKKTNKDNTLNDFYNTNKSFIDDIQIFYSIRNDNGCHYNEWAEGRSESEVNEFAKAVIDLYCKVYCNKCGNFVIKDGDIYHCRCNQITY